MQSASRHDFEFTKARILSHLGPVRIARGRAQPVADDGAHARVGERRGELLARAERGEDELGEERREARVRVVCERGARVKVAVVKGGDQEQSPVTCQETKEKFAISTLQAAVSCIASTSFIEPASVIPPIVYEAEIPVDS